MTTFGTGEYGMTDESNFKKWYAKNKAEFNRRRKEKYANDPEYSQKARERQRQYRQDNPYSGRRVHTRVVAGIEQTVYRIGDVAGMIGRSEQVLRLWEKNKIIPSPTVPGSHRYYTLYQIELLKELVEVFNEVRYKPLIRKEAISKKSAETFLKWSD